MKTNSFLLAAGIALAMALAFLACEEKGKKASDPSEVKAEETEEEDAGESQIFKAVKIGEQTWMAENLKVKTGESWCYDDKESNCKKYGRLYNWETARMACPEGWHLPSSGEWGVLHDYLGGLVASKLKSTSGWNNNGSGTDEYEFSALPGGYRNSKGSFDAGSHSYWWTAKKDGSRGTAYYLHMDYNGNTIFNTYGDFSDNSSGYSVRCIQDILAPDYQDIELNGISADSDQIHQAVLFALESFAYSSFPFPLIEWYDYTTLRNRESRFEEFDRFIAKHDKQGFGKSFQFLFKQAYLQKEKDLAKWLQSCIKLVAPMIPREMYVANGWDAMVRQLLIAYEDIAANPDAFHQIYDIMDSQGMYYSSSVDAYAEILPFVREDRLESFILKHGEDGYVKLGEVNRWAVVWAYSFWGRRYHENPGNIKPIVATLRLFRDELFAAP